MKNDRLENIIDYINQQPKNECIICGEIRQLHEAHIIPSCMGISDEFMLLCPSHHQYYDNAVLSNKEKRIIKDIFLKCVRSYMPEVEKYFKDISLKGLKMHSKCYGFIDMLNYVWSEVKDEAKNINIIC